MKVRIISFVKTLFQRQRFCSDEWEWEIFMNTGYVRILKMGGSCITCSVEEEREDQDERR